jgi:hypothetical protein
MPPPEPITVALEVPDADPQTVHALLTDIAAWRLWSPHVASVVPDHGTVQPGQTVATRAFFSPAVTPMHVDWVRPGEGMGWHSRAAGHTLTYENRVSPLAGGTGTCIAFTARVDGPAAGAVTALAAPLSRLGMRRRIARLARLALLVQGQAGAGGGGGRAGS